MREEKEMKVYKNPFVSRESYFVRTGVARTGKMEASASNGYVVEFVGGKWNVRKGKYYDISLKNEFPVVAENKVSINSVIERAVLVVVLDAVAGAKMDGGNDETT